MAGLPEIERNGDAWSLAWRDKGVAIGFDGLKDHSDGLKAEVTVESTIAGRVIGPVTLNILAMQSQQTFSKRCHERVNSLPREEWDQIVIYACGIVAKQYRAPSPTVRLNRLTDLGPVEFLVPGLIPIGETTFVYGDGECLAAGSVVQGPAGSERVEVLAKRGLPVPVWTLGSAGKTWAWASAPWLKGCGVLLRFKLDDGRAITVAGRHRFLTPAGWRYASEIAVGELLAVSRPSPLLSIAGRDPRVSLLSVQHCSQTPSSCRGGCWPYCRRYGRPPRPDASDDLMSAPSQDGALARIRGDSRRGAQASSRARSHDLSSGRPASGGCVPFALLASDEGSSDAAWHATPHSGNNPAQWPSRLASVPDLPKDAHRLFDFQSLLALDRAVPKPSLPPFETLTYRNVVSIAIVGDGNYYDLSVPGTENYLANGIWHHNSCKSLIAQRIGISIVTGAPLPWGDRPSRTANVLICDWETNERTVGLRVSRLCLGLGVPVPEILYRGTLRSVQAPPLRYLEDEVPALREQIQREQIGLVIIDSLSFAVRGKLVDDDVARQAIYDLRQLGPATRLVVAHVSKDAAHSVGGRVDPFGSAFFRNGLRSGFEVRKTEDQHSGSVIDLGVFQHKNNDAEHMKPFGMSVHFEGNAGAIEIVQQDIQAIPDLASRTSVSSRLRTLLARGAQTIEQLSETTGEKESTIRKTLNRMSDVSNLNPGRGGAGNRAMWGLRERSELPG